MVNEEVLTRTRSDAFYLKTEREGPRHVRCGSLRHGINLQWTFCRFQTGLSPDGCACNAPSDTIQIPCRTVTAQPPTHFSAFERAAPPIASHCTFSSAREVRADSVAIRNDIFHEIHIYCAEMPQRSLRGCRAR